MKIFLKGKEREDCLTGEAAKLDKKDSLSKPWRKEDNMAWSWLINP